VRMRRSILLSTLFVLAAWSGATQPVLKPRFANTPENVTVVYSSDLVRQASSSVELVSERYSGPVCIVFTELSRFPVAAVPSAAIDYQLYDPTEASRLPVDGNPTSAQETLSSVFPPGSKKNDRLTLDFLVKTRPANVPASGMHTITMKADLYASAFPPSGGVIESSTFFIIIQVHDHFDVSTVPTGGAFSVSSVTALLDFGALQPYDSRGADVLVRSNVSFVLSLTSMNGSAFVNVEDGFRLPYSLDVNGGAVTLAPGLRTVIANGVPPGFGDPTRFSLVVTILPYSSLPTEGSYSDHITITLAAR
jgi:hypothetical protein